MKRMNLATKLIGALTMISTVIAGTACFWDWHQPQEPQALR